MCFIVLILHTFFSMFLCLSWLLVMWFFLFWSWCRIHRFWFWSWLRFRLWSPRFWSWFRSRFWMIPMRRLSRWYMDKYWFINTDILISTYNIVPLFITFCVTGIVRIVKIVTTVCFICPIYAPVIICIYT